MAEEEETKPFMVFHEADRDHDFFRFVDEYFTSNKSVSDFCDKLTKCLEKTKNDNSDFDYMYFLKEFEVLYEDLSKVMLKSYRKEKEIDKKVERISGRRDKIMLALIPVSPFILCSKRLTSFLVSKWNKTKVTIKREKRERSAMLSMMFGAMEARRNIKKINGLVKELETVEISSGVTEEKQKLFDSILVNLKLAIERCDGRTQGSAERFAKFLSDNVSN